MAAGTTTVVATPVGLLSRFRPKYLLFGFIGLMFAYVAVRFEGFLIDRTSPEWPHIEPFKWWLLLHGIAGGAALILGPMQFSDRLRQRYAKLHRVVGRIYVIGVLIAAPLGLYIQWVSQLLGRYAPSFTIETVIQSGLWFATTAIALVFILQGKVQQHRKWMTRSFGTGPLIFLEVRVILGLTGVAEKYGPGGVETVVWICTASSIFVADCVLQVQELLQSRSNAKTRAAQAALAVGQPT